MIKRLLLVALIASGLWYVSYGYKIQQAKQAQAKAYVKSLRQAYPRVIINEINYARNSKKVLLFIYKANCLMCRYHFPDIKKIAKKYERNVHLVAVSVDDDPLKTAAYLYKQKISFTPYVITGTTVNGFVKELQGNFQVHFDGGVPYTVMLTGTDIPREFGNGPGFYKRIEDYINGRN